MAFKNDPEGRGECIEWKFSPLHLESDNRLPTIAIRVRDPAAIIREGLVPFGRVPIGIGCRRLLGAAMPIELKQVVREAPHLPLSGYILVPS